MRTKSYLPVIKLLNAHPWSSLRVIFRQNHQPKKTKVKPTAAAKAEAKQRSMVKFLKKNPQADKDKDGKISKFIHISRDITQHKKEEDELTHRLEQMVEDRTRQLKETHEKLLHQDKMSSLGKLSASVVHEINNPIAGILNLILLMKRIASEDSVTEKEIEQFKRYLDLMENETRRTSRIVSNLLAFARQSKMEPKWNQSV